MGFLDKFKSRKPASKTDSSPKATLQMPVACPTCGVVLDPPPQRSRNCTECGSKIVIRTDRTAKQKVYLTSEGAAAFDVEKAAASAKKKALKRTQAIGLTTADYEATAAELTEEFGTQAGPGDVFWKLANEELLRLGNPRRNGYDMQQIHMQMALQLKDEGRSAVPIQRKGHKDRLWWEKTQIDAVDGDASQWRTAAIANACCDQCEQFDGRTYTFKEAIEKMPLPPDDCTSDWCNCSWTNVPPN
jgi:predicted RNA-binding Zn-ribbon protein involved in translation (DUF1610 family)